MKCHIVLMATYSLLLEAQGPFGLYSPKKPKRGWSKSCVDELLLRSCAEHIGSFNACLSARRGLPQSLRGRPVLEELATNNYHAVMDLWPTRSFH
jgi:hypothetical protein